jgi:hypothetical protein
LAGKAFSALEELRTSANDGFVHVVRIAATSDDEVGVVARDEQAAESVSYCDAGCDDLLLERTHELVARQVSHVDDGGGVSVTR